MSLFQNSSSSFGSAGITSLHQPRPVLKRSQTPYRSSAESKRRRTSPTGAFSRLSLSPTSARPTETRLLNSPAAPSSFLSPTAEHKNYNEPIHNRSFNDTFGANNTFQFGLNNVSQPPYTSSPHQSSSSFSPKETKMKSIYSAYDIDSNRIFIESLSDGERSPTPSVQLEEDQTQEPSTLELSPKVAHQLSAHHHRQRNQSANILLNSYRFISDPDSSDNHQQLVLYRRPIWRSFDKLDPCLTPKLHNDNDLSEPQIVEIDDLDHDVDIEPLDSNQVVSPRPTDSMELD